MNHADLGLRIQAHPKPWVVAVSGNGFDSANPPPTHALALLSQTASESYKTALLPDALVPQVSTLLDEAPLPLIVSGLEEVTQRTHTPQGTLKNLTNWAQALQSLRTAWV
jgi:hypothetical protein